MDFTSVIKIICILSLACTLLYTLLPGNKSDKSLKLVISAFFLVVVFAPISDFLANIDTYVDRMFSYSDAADEAFSTSLDGMVIEKTSEGIERYIGEKLTEKGINRHCVSVYMETDNEHILRFKHVQVVVDYQYILMMPMVEKAVADITCGEGTVDVTADNIKDEI